MSNHRGRTWDACEIVLPDGSEARGYFDTSWGSRFYFSREQQWYAGRIAEFEVPGAADGGVLRCDLRHRTRFY